MFVKFIRVANLPVPEEKTKALEDLLPLLDA